MHRMLHNGLRAGVAAPGLWLLLALGAVPADAGIRLYENVDYRGASRSFDEDVADLRDDDWNDRASSLRIDEGTWEICRDTNFRDCRQLTSDQRDLATRRGWNDEISSLRRVDQQAGIELFVDIDYRGASLEVDEDVADLRDLDWNDRVSSVRVHDGVWELCRDKDYRDCHEVDSDAPDLRRLGGNDAISSLRRVDGSGGSDYAEIEVFVDYDYRGASRSFSEAVDRLSDEGWNDRISSVRVVSGRWEICRHNDYRDCRELDRDQRRMGDDWNDEISSLRPVGDDD
jgi:hypothetical protein